MEWRDVRLLEVGLNRIVVALVFIGLSIISLAITIAIK